MLLEHKCRSLLFALLALFVAFPVAEAEWRNDSRYPKWAQRGRMLYLDARWIRTEQDYRMLERFCKLGATPFLHAFTPHWPHDRKLALRLARNGIPVDVRVEGSLFFEDDHIDRFVFVHGSFRPGGWWYNHAWRTNYNWYKYFPESIKATSRRRNGDERPAYAFHRVTTRREGSPIAPEHRLVRAKQIDWLLRDIDPLPDVPMRPYENPSAKDARLPYPMLGMYHGLWYDNPSSSPSYDVASRDAWEKHFKEKFGVAVWDPPSHADAGVRREWARFWADAWADFYLWRKNYQDEAVRKAGKPFCFSSGNFSFLSRPWGSVQFYWAKKGVVDMLGPCEYSRAYNRGRYHFLIKTVLAASHGRPAGPYVANEMNVAECIATSGTNIYYARPELAEFLAVNADLFGRTQPGGRIALLFHTEQNLVESQLISLQALADQITDLGFPYEVIIEDDLDSGEALARQFPILIISNTDLSKAESGMLQKYLQGGGSLIIIGDCLVEKPRYYDLRAPQKWRPFQAIETMLQAGAPVKEELRILADHRQFLPTAELADAIARFGGPGFKLKTADPDVLINVLRQPAGNITLVGLVNYAGQTKKDVAFVLPPDLKARGAGWVSSDGGGNLLKIENGIITVPELRYGCVVLLGNDPAAIKRIVSRSAELYPRKPIREPKPGRKYPQAMNYGKWRARRIDETQVPAGTTLCRYRAGSSDRGGHLLLDILAPKKAETGRPVEFKLKVLDARYDHVEYWQLILENTASGKRHTVPVSLPEDNPYGMGRRLIGKTLTAAWTPPAGSSGTYRVFIAYRVVSVREDGEPFLTPPDEYIGYSGKTPSNQFLRSQPLPKRLYEDRLRAVVLSVK